MIRGLDCYFARGGSRGQNQDLRRIADESSGCMLLNGNGSAPVPLVRLRKIFRKCPIKVDKFSAALQ